MYKSAFLLYFLGLLVWTANVVGEEEYTIKNIFTPGEYLLVQKSDTTFVSNVYNDSTSSQSTSCIRWDMKVEKGTQPDVNHVTLQATQIMSSFVPGS